MRGGIGGNAVVREFVFGGALDGTVEHEDGAVVGRLEDQDILVFGLFCMEDFFHPQGLGHAWPLVAGFVEPSFCHFMLIERYHYDDEDDEGSST